MLSLEDQVKQCQKPDEFYHCVYSNTELKRMGKQLFCSTCERYQFKKKRCRLFKEGVQFGNY